MRPLSEEQAWAFAMAYQDELQGRVKLVLGHNMHGFDITESYRWIQIDFAGSWSDGMYPVEDPMRLAANVRMASIVWCMLSKCPGYGRLENPIFWKRVMGELNRLRDPDSWRPVAVLPETDYFESVSDSIRFFDSPDHSFPSLWLELKIQGPGTEAYKTDSDRSITQVLFGLVQYEPGQQERQAKLHTILEQLQAYLPLGTNPGDCVITVGVNPNDTSLREGPPLNTSQQESALPVFRRPTLPPRSRISQFRSRFSRTAFDDLFAQLPRTKTVRTVEVFFVGTPWCPRPRRRGLRDARKRAVPP